jgi:hypothetical protein
MTHVSYRWNFRLTDMSYSPVEKFRSSKNYRSYNFELCETSDLATGAVGQVKLQVDLELQELPES